MPSFLGDYVYYSSGNETPESYLQWGGLSILGHLLGHKTCIVHGDRWAGGFRFRPNLFVCLVGEAGSGKNTALGVNSDIMIKHFQDWLLSASIQSREDIALQMSDDHVCMRSYTNKGENAVESYRPFYILNNELASFLSVDKLKMVEFLTEVFDGKRFGTGFKKDRQQNPQKPQWFQNPHLSLIAGAVPQWFMGSLRMDLFSGGLGRRLIIVNSSRDKIIPFPIQPPGADAAMGRVLEHLKRAEAYIGEVELTPRAKLWWTEWYTKYRKENPSDPILNQFHQTKSMQVLKVALLFRMTEWPFPDTVETGVDDAHLQMAEHSVDGLIPTITKLTSGIGRNELAGVGAQLLDLLERRGMESEVNIKKFFHRYARTQEFQDIENHYISTREIVTETLVKDGVARKFYFSIGGYEEYCRMKAGIIKKPLEAPTSALDKPVP